MVSIRSGFPFVDVGRAEYVILLDDVEPASRVRLQVLVSPRGIGDKEARIARYVRLWA